MRLELRAKGIRMTDELREFIDRKLHSALGRLGHRVGRVRVRLTDVNGPRGGEDIESHIRASLGPAGFVTINETHRDPFAAVARASERVGRHLSRTVSRTRRGRRER